MNSNELRKALSKAEERCAELEAELAKVTAERDEARRELYRALMDMAAGFAGITPGAE